MGFFMLKRGEFIKNQGNKEVAVIGLGGPRIYEASFGFIGRNSRNCIPTERFINSGIIYKGIGR
jgi:hypothetical protein